MSRTSALAHGELTDAALHVMLALTRPRHGYAVMQFLTERSDGRLTLGPASLYTTLKKLRDAGFIEELDGDDARRVHRLTPRGRGVLMSDIDRRRHLLAMADQIMETT